jgi:hypothetical protein
MLRIAHCLDNRLTDGGKAVSPIHIIIFSFATHFCYRLSKPRGLVQPKGVVKFQKNEFTSSDVEPATFQLIAQCLNHYNIIRVLVLREKATYRVYSAERFNYIDEELLSTADSMFC